MGKEGTLRITGTSIKHSKQEGSSNSYGAGEFVAHIHSFFSVIDIPQRNRIGAKDGTDHTNTAHQKGQHDPKKLTGKSGKGQAQDQTGNNGHFVRFEDIGSHTGTVTDVVPHQVSDDGCVAGVVFFHAGFDLTHQVSANVSSFGVDPTTDAHEKGQQGATKAKAQEHIGRCLSKDDKDQGATEQTKAIG